MGSDNHFNMNLQVAKLTMPLQLMCNNINDADGRSDNQPVYIGYAAPGTGSSEPKWAIKKLTYTGSVYVSTTWASGDAEFDKTWTSRTSYTYS